MTSAALELLQRFQHANWFSKSGTDDALADASRIATWKEAARMCKRRYHENVQTESQNVLTMQLFSLAKHRYRRWNDLANEIRPEVDRIISESIVPNAFGYKMDDKVRIYARIDLMMALMELEYADIVPPRYFAERAKWYLAGRFPCGWDGDFPEGRLFVF